MPDTDDCWPSEPAVTGLHVGDEGSWIDGMETLSRADSEYVLRIEGVW